MGLALSLTLKCPWLFNSLYLAGVHSDSFMCSFLGSFMISVTRDVSFSAEVSFPSNRFLGENPKKTRTALILGPHVGLCL